MYRQYIRKGIACFLGFLLLSQSFFTISAYAVNQNNNVQARLNQVLSEYPDGSYFSVNGKSCPAGSGNSCPNCNLINILEAKGIKIPGQGPAWTCLGFATYVYYSVFGQGMNRHKNMALISSGNLDNPETFSKANLGDIVLFYASSTSGDKSYTHVAVFMGRTSQGVILYDSNVGGTNKVHYGEISYDNIVDAYTSRTNGKREFCKIYHANNYDMVNGSSSISIPGGNTPSPALKYWNCDTIISCFKGKTVNLYNNPGDSSRVTCFSKGQTAKSARGATLGDDSIWYSVTVNHNGSDRLLWLKYDGNKMTYEDIDDKPTYNVILDNGSSCRQITVTNGSTYGDLENPTRDGYIFDGWYTQKSGGTRITSSTTVNLTGSQTLYAHWEKDNTTSPHDCDYIDDVCSICGAILSSDNGFDSSVAGKYVVIADKAYVRTGPYQSKSEVYRLNRWGEVDVVGSVINSYGNMWLKTSDGYYTHADKLKRVVEQPQKTEITFNGLTTPGNLAVGKGGHIDGSITSSNSPICSVRAEVCDSSGNVYLTASSSGFSRSTYGPIKNSKIDSNLTFGKLPAGNYYIKYTVTTEDNTTASAKTSVFSVFNANNYDAANGSSTPSDPDGNTSSSTLNYWNCNTIISCFNGQTVNLYSNPGDSSRVTYFSKGQTAKSTRGATLSDGSIWYSVTVNHNGTNKLLWLKYDGSKMTYTDISN